MIFKRALHKELIFFTLTVYAALVLTTLTFTLIRLLSQASLGKIDPTTVFVLLGFSVIAYQGLIIALSVFLGALLTFARLWREHEMVVWQASGLSLRRFVGPTLRFALPVALFAAVMGMVVAPWANRQQDNFRVQFTQRDDLSRLATGRFRESAGGTRVFYVTELDPKTTLASNLFIVDRQPARANQVATESVVVAQTGAVNTEAGGDKYLTLDQGRRYIVPRQLASVSSVDTDRSDPTLNYFDSYKTLVSELPEAPVAGEPYKIQSTIAVAMDRSDGARAELLWRVAGPLMCIVLAILAIPLSYFSPRTGRSSPMVASIIVFIIYVNVLNATQNNLAVGKIRALGATFGPHLIVLILALVLLLWRGQSLLWLTGRLRRALLSLLPAARTKPIAVARAA